METTIHQTGMQIWPAYMTSVARGSSESGIVPATIQIVNEQKAPARLPFIEANTREVELNHLSDDCIIPVFSKDNEVTISHQSFISGMQDAARVIFPYEDITDPAIRVSHVVKGRIPEAMHKPVSELLESDKTIYYERMMFCFEVPSIYQEVEGCRLNLTIGGVRAYNEQNLYSRKAPERFKIFIGFKNLVCCNMCVSTDGYMSSLRVMDIQALISAAMDLFRGYDMQRHLATMAAYKDCGMSESQFAQFLGKCRMYQYLPSRVRKALPEILLTDTQIGLVARAYYEDENFGAEGNGAISLWKVYNLFTGANKSSYIDNFLDRASNATDVTVGLARALHGDPEYSWFLC